MQLEVGKLYKTRDGRVVFITAQKEKLGWRQVFSFIGKFMDGESDTYSWRADGFFTDGPPCGDDIIAEVTPPVPAQPQNTCGVAEKAADKPQPGDWVEWTEGRYYLQAFSHTGDQAYLMTSPKRPSSSGGLWVDQKDIKPWREKKKVRLHGFINVYQDGSRSGLYADRTYADRADYNRMACIEIDREVTEGEGLDNA